MDPRNPFLAPANILPFIATIVVHVVVVANIERGVSKYEIYRASLDFREQLYAITLMNSILW
jgi:hypothetical protein